MNTIFIRDQNGKAYSLPRPFEIVTTPGEPCYDGFVALVKNGESRRPLKPWTAKEAIDYLRKGIRNSSDEVEYIYSIRSDGVEVFFHSPSCRQFRSYEDLVRGYVTIDGKPCGTYEEITQ